MAATSAVNAALADLLAALPPWVKTREEDRRDRAAESLLLYGSAYLCRRCGDVLDPVTRQHRYGCEATA